MPSADERPTLEVGRIVKAHGLRGQVLVDLWTDRSERLDVGTELSSLRGTLVVQAAAAHQDRFIVSFDRIVTREDAELWRGVVLSAPRIEVDDVIWIDELFGADVFDASGLLRGTVVDVESNPASDILVLDTGALVPLTFVTNVQANERIDVDVPEGLFE
jgi:16S rRNA processing protein RimM